MDELCPLRIARFCEALVCSGPAGPEEPGSSQVDVSVTLLCLHCLPNVSLQIGQQKVFIPRKNRGMLTGSSSAAAAGRIPPADVALQRVPHWRRMGLGMKIEGLEDPLCLMSFVDNFITLGPSSLANSLLLDDCEACLQRCWGLRFGAGSRELLPCYMSQEPVPADLEKWPLKSHLKSLGCVLQNNAQSNLCVTQSIQKAHASMALNLGPGLRKSSRASKLRFMKQSVMSLMSWKWGAWPFLKSTAETLDSLQRCLVALLWRVEERPGEPFVEKQDRQRQDTTQVCDDMGWWSGLWARDVVRWHNHCQRNTCKSWVKPISK